MLNRRFMAPATAALVALTFVACQDGGLALDEVDAPEFRKSSGGSSAADAADAALLALSDEVNARLAEDGAGYRAVTAEWIAGSGSDEVGRTVFFSNVGNKQLGNDFVPFDARRAPWSGPVSGPTDDITYIVDQFPPQAATTLPLLVTTAAIDRAMATWNGEQCSTLPITKLPDVPGLNPGFLGFLGESGAFADINHSGWLPPFLLPPPILGVAFTFAFCAPCAPPTVFTDIDNNGKIDTAFKFIYYANFFPWADDGATDFDVQTVALHEAGHGLSQGHFGKLFRTDKNGKFHFAPKAVMNAGYTGPQRALLGTDNGGHCSNWAQWPNN